MKIHIGKLRKLIREILEQERKKNHWGGSFPDENYEEELLSDPGYEAKSVYVPDDVKQKINKWAKKMGLAKSKE